MSARNWHEKLAKEFAVRAGQLAQSSPAKK
jgi:hypothetical protein